MGMLQALGMGQRIAAIAGAATGAAKALTPMLGKKKKKLAPGAAGAAAATATSTPAKVPATEATGY